MVLAPVFDILGVGCAAVDTRLHVTTFPAADDKVRILSQERRLGGLTAIALLAAARLGARCAFGGALGRDIDSQFILKRLTAEGIALDFMVQEESARPITSTIIVGDNDHTRTVFYDLSHSLATTTLGLTEKIVGLARVLCVDGYGATRAVKAAEMARFMSIRVVADLERE